VKIVIESPMGRETLMKKRWVLMLLFAVASCLPSLAQTARVQGTVRDIEGKPIPGAVVEFHNRDTGQLFSLKTDKKGEYLSIGVGIGTYDIVVKQDAKEIFHLDKVHLGLDGLTQDIDLQKEQQQAAKQSGMTPEQLKQQQELQAKQQQRTSTVKTLNEKLAAAGEQAKANDFDGAIKTLNEAAQMAPDEDLLWARLGEIQIDAATKETDNAAKTQRYTDAATNLQKAIDLKQKAATGQGTAPKPAATGAPPDKNLAAYYNDLGRADTKLGKPDDAIKAYEQAVQVDPTGAAQYYYNEGATLTNAGKLDEAIAAFDKSIAADPNRADAYYQKGVNLISKATTDASGKITPAPGTQEALNKYLELQPTGPYAENAKSMIQYIGGTVETSFGKKKSASTKK
jgi:tetratricopeptide (TPR) repeat protein